MYEACFQFMKHFYTILLSVFLLSWSIGYTQDFSASEQRTIDSLRAITTSDSHDTSKANACLQLALILYVSEFEQLFALSRQAKEIAQSNLKKKDLPETVHRRFLEISSEANNNIGYYYQALGYYKTAMDYYGYCIEIDKKTGNAVGLSSTLNNMGMIYNYQGDVLRSLEFFLLSLKIDETLGDDVELGPSLNNIAYIYEHQNDTLRALKYYNRALHEFQKTGDQYGQAAVLINLGSIARKQNKTDLALDYFNQSLTLQRQLGNKDGEASALLNLGKLQFDLGDFESSKTTLETCLQIHENSHDEQGITITMINLGKIYLKSNELNKAQETGEKAFALAQKSGHVYNLKNASELLSEIYRNQRRFEESLDMHVLSVSLRDSLFNRETEKATLEKGLAYEYEKKELLRDAQYQQQIQLENIRHKNQLIIILLISIILVVILIFSIILIKRLKETRVQKKMIEEKNTENELLLGEIHHRVKNNLQVIASLLSLQEKSVTDESAKRAILEGKERVNSMGLIHKLLYQNDRFTGIEMNDYISKLIDGLMNSFGYEKSNLQLDIDFPEIKLDVDSAVPIGLIINELVINAFKYAYENIENPELKVKLKQQGDHLHLEIEDNGNGRPEDMHSSNSFGYKLVKSLVRQIRGEMSVTVQKGLNYSIEIRDFKLVS